MKHIIIFICINSAFIPSLVFAEVQNSTTVSEFNNTQALELITEFNNWYIKGSNDRTVESTQIIDVQPQSTWLFNGGYRHQLPQGLSIFVEGGVNHEYSDLAQQRGFNLGTGISYQPIQSLSLQSRYTQRQMESEPNTTHGFEFSSVLNVKQNIDLKAAYQVEAHQEQFEQQLQIGLGYRF